MPLPVLLRNRRNMKKYEILIKVSSSRRALIALARDLYFTWSSKTTMFRTPIIKCLIVNKPCLAFPFELPHHLHQLTFLFSCPSCDFLDEAKIKESKWIFRMSAAEKNFFFLTSFTLTLRIKVPPPYNLVYYHWMHAGGSLTLIKKKLCLTPKSLIHH